MSAQATAIRSHTEFLTMSSVEREEYERWRDARTPHRDGSAQQRAFIAGMRAQAARVTAVRVVGECTSCGSDTEGEGAEQLSLCCGSRINERPEDPWSTR